MFLTADQGRRCLSFRFGG